MLSIYHYQNPCEYLKDSFKQKKQVNPRFTVRAWAQQMGHKHHNAINEILNGKRKIPKAQVPKFIKTLKLSATEGLYLDVLVDLQRSKNVEEKTMHMERLKSLSPRKKVILDELENFKIVKSPLHIYIAELALKPNFNRDPAWIQKQLKIEATQLEIKEALERLLAMDILREDVNGKIHRMFPHLNSRSDIHDVAVKEYHLMVMEYAKKAIFEQDVLEREYQGTAFNMRPEKLKEAKADIRNFIKEFIAKYETNETGREELYQLNLQFFGITNKENL